MSATDPHPLPGGLALSVPKDADIDATLHTAPLVAEYYLPLVDYSRNLSHPFVSVGDTVLAGELLAPGIIAPTSGTITEHIEHSWPHPSNTTAPTLVLTSDGQDQATSTSSTSCADRDAQLKRIEAAAVHGLGGAGFSTAAKIQRACELGTPTLVVNAVECEPGICCDDALMQQEPKAVLEACQTLVTLLGASSALFAIEDDKRLALNALTACQPTQHAVELISLPALYPSGAEAPLIQRLTGLVLARGQRAADVGVLCLNVATVLSIHNALQGQAATTRIVSITTQDLRHSINVRTRFGTPLNALVQFAQSINPGIAKAYDKNPSTITVGGPLSGFQKTLDAAPVLTTTNAILIGAPVPPAAPSPCIRCTECASVCPVNLLPQELYTAAVAKNLDTANRYSLDACVLCGCCDLVCPANIPLTPWFRFAKDSQRLRQQEKIAAELAKERSENRTTRVARLAAEKAEADTARLAVAAQRKDSAVDIKAALARAKNRRSQS